MIKTKEMKYLIITAYDTAYLIANLFSVYTVIRFMRIFFSPKEGFVKQSVCVYILYFLVSSVFHFVVDIPIVMLIVNFTLLYLISCCYEADFKKRFLASVYIYFVGFAVEVVMTAFTMAKINPFDRYGYTNIAGLFVCKVLTFFVVLLIGNVVNVRKNQSLPVWLFVSSILIPVVTIVLEFLFCITGCSSTIIVLSVVALFFINAVTFFLYDSISAAYDKQLESAIAEQERNYYYHQCVLMQESAEDIRSFRHDINNHITVLQQLIYNGNEKETKSYIDELACAHQKLKIPYSATGNVVVDSILNYKLASITNPNMQVEVEASVPTELSVEVMDLSVILTNLLDNALTAAMKVGYDSHIFTKIVYQKGMLVIQISNSYDGIIQYENGELVTTKTGASGHGRGLQNVRKIAEKYQGLLSLNYDEKVFTAKVLLYVE